MDKVIYIFWCVISFSLLILMANALNEVTELESEIEFLKQENAILQDDVWSLSQYLMKQQEAD
ncbi:hypothetical protein [Oceanobacillus sp. CF4.6]|uniref:hypothetical protein n=1 Tax=Oceanobacillus sp. CF4.6 TaxID=3373080 RepID=UPI003EE4E795